jgi:hypothetical protein
MVDASPAGAWLGVAGLPAALLAALAALSPGLLMAQERSAFAGRVGKLTTIYGSVGMEAEKYRYDALDDCQDRQRLRTRFDINGRGFVWDPRFATFDAGITLQRENIQTRGSGADGNTSLNLLGYRLSTTWFANRPYPLTLYAGRSQSTVSDFWSPSYELTTTNMGARWGMENRWLGRTGFYVDSSKSESGSTLVPRSEQNLSLGMDSTQTIRPKQWGQSDLSYGYRHTAWDEKVYGGQQRQDYMYLSDHTSFGEKANAMANVTYFNRSDQWPFAGLSNSTMKSSFFGLNSMFTVQQTDSLRYNFGMGLGMSDAAGSRNNSHNLTGAVNYRLNERWQTTGTLGLSGSSSEVPAQLGVAAQNQQSSSVSSSGSVLYSDLLGNYLLSGGYTLMFAQTTTSGSSATASGQPAQQNTTHTAQAGYTRMNSPLFADSLQLRMSRTRGESSGSESNIRYSVTSLLSQSDMLQGIVEHRRYQQESTSLSSDVTNPNYYYYNMNSRSTRLDFGWLHRFSLTGSMMVSAGMTSGETQGFATDTRYVQARTAMRLRGALQWTALARMEQIVGFQSIAGRKTTIESDLVYPFGKWEATLRYRFRDAKMDYAPFKEQSIMFLLKRNFGFRR